MATVTFSGNSLLIELSKDEVLSLLSKQGREDGRRQIVLSKVDGYNGELIVRLNDKPVQYRHRDIASEAHGTVPPLP